MEHLLVLCRTTIEQNTMLMIQRFAGVMGGIIGANNKFGQDFNHPDADMQGNITALYDSQSFSRFFSLVDSQDVGLLPLFRPDLDPFSQRCPFFNSSAGLRWPDIELTTVRSSQSDASSAVS